jgi:mannose/cellobiose epimerase-like protein (N-acyl-D-glucosamine 2-epimerase family)
MEKQFWEAEHNAYADERDISLASLSDYRGQNANMHSVEALIAAYEATGDEQFLTRAKQITHQFCVVLTAQSRGQIWEHYDASWQVDWQYNVDKPDDLFKPWGFQPGHQIEWAKLLLQLDWISPEDWYLETAIQLFDTAIEKAGTRLMAGWFMAMPQMAALPMPINISGYRQRRLLHPGGYISAPCLRAIRKIITGYGNGHGII